MANIDAARAEVQKVVSLLVNRFGHEHEVFAHLTLALDHLREAAPVKEAVIEEPTVTVQAEEEAVSAPPPPPASPPEPTRETRQRRYNR